ncbi:hypothetical protein [Brevundimonas sp. R86498]|uniref:hypothetical protein n=1 Tax=Brevundimonas sp. R86498 TaxID=3093845 RepID=UPI0037C7084F
MTHPLIQSLSQPAVRHGLMASGAVVLVCIGGFAALAGGAEDTPRRSGPALAIAVVAPVEPEIDPGAPMEVGILSTGFEKAALDRAAQERAEMRADASLSATDAWAGEVWSPDGTPRMPSPTPVTHRLSPMEAYDAVVAQGRRWIGRNDGPDEAWPGRRRDRAAEERAARWAARADGRDTGDSHPGTGPVAYTDVIKYSSE